MNKIIVPTIESVDYNSILEDVLSINEYTPIRKKYNYVAYKGGKVIGVYATVEEAGAVSRIYERICTNLDEYRENKAFCKALTELASNIQAKNVLSELGVSINDTTSSIMVDMLGQQARCPYSIIELFDNFQKLFSVK